MSTTNVLHKIATLLETQLEHQRQTRKTTDELLNRIATLLENQWDDTRRAREAAEDNQKQKDAIQLYSGLSVVVGDHHRFTFPFASCLCRHTSSNECVKQQNVVHSGSSLGGYHRFRPISGRINRDRRNNIWRHRSEEFEKGSLERKRLGILAVE
ncbi:hypothetical protein GALMADRAFT_255733 [Galerina marginata CBS 339.88]|uniref:Uncharacterized protein n=1 Tax=Galerina marginata (strain CBS 339.88) TaxID=685588 RepID=A0A067SG19_GALM3|nr:hypothetical protein GALMADRAFT_255733 [Galerina marginata CBS 339.88]